jgi:hypothetical protein
MGEDVNWRRVGYGFIMAAIVGMSGPASGAGSTNVLNEQHGKSMVQCGEPQRIVTYSGTTDVESVRRICIEALRLASLCSSGKCGIAGIERISELKLLPLLAAKRLNGIQVSSGLPIFVGFGRVNELGVVLVLEPIDSGWRNERWAVTLP